MSCQIKVKDEEEARLLLEQIKTDWENPSQDSCVLINPEEVTFYNWSNIMERLYETREAAKILQLSQRRIINWVERGFIVPSKKGQGPGIRRKYSFDNIVQIRIMDELIC